MKPSAFAFVRPPDLPAAVAALQQPGQVMPVAGGQSLVVLLRLRLTTVETLVDIGRLPELAATRAGDDAVLFGAATTHAAFEDGLVPDASLGMMRHAAAGIAYRAVRNFGTIGGSLALSDPSADWPLCLLALDATAVLAGPAGAREVAMDAFLIASFTTALQPGEIITGVRVPHLPRGSRWGYVKLARQQGAYADSLAAAVWPAGGAPRIALGATMRRPGLLPQTMAALAAAPDADATVLAQVIAADIDDVDPDADSYRRRCHIATVQKAIRQMRQG